MKWKSLATGVMLVCAVSVQLPGRAAGADQASVVDEILEILRSSNQIDEAKYEELRRRAEEERKRAAPVEAAEEKTSVPVETAEEETPEKTAEKAPENFRVYFKDAVRFETADKKFQFKLGGRIQNDWAIMDPDRDTARHFKGLSGFESGTEFRRARIYLAGTIYDHFEFKNQIDFSGGEVELNDVYLAVTGIPWVDSLRIGHFHEPFSLEQLTSSNWVTFMERSTSSSLDEGRNTGVAFYARSDDQRVTFSAGGFRLTNPSGKGFSGDGAYNITARLTGLPWYEDDGRRLLHLGVGYRHGFRSNDEVRFANKPEAHLSPVNYVDTGDFASDDFNIIDPQVALVVGPFSVQGEYRHGFAQLPENSNVNAFGYYAQASYFLTGESRPYNTETASFDRVRPKHNFLGQDGGWGAWEVAARYSYIDLDSKSIEGGKLGDVTGGLNWYLNPVFRVTFNYVFADLKDVGDTHIAETRFQLAL